MTLSGREEWKRDGRLMLEAGRKANKMAEGLSSRNEFVRETVMEELKDTSPRLAAYLGAEVYRRLSIHNKPAAIQFLIDTLAAAAGK